MAEQIQIHLFLFLLLQDYFLCVAVSYGIPINVPVVYMVRYVVVLYINFALCMLLVWVRGGGGAGEACLESKITGRYGLVQLKPKPLTNF